MAVAKVWDGSEWVPAKWKTYNGSEWVEQSKVWDGSEWERIGGGIDSRYIVGVSPVSVYTAVAVPTHEPGDILMVIGSSPASGFIGPDTTTAAIPYPYRIATADEPSSYALEDWAVGMPTIMVALRGLSDDPRYWMYAVASGGTAAPSLPGHGDGLLIAAGGYLDFDPLPVTVSSPAGMTPLIEQPVEVSYPDFDLRAWGFSALAYEDDPPAPTGARQFDFSGPAPEQFAESFFIPSADDLPPLPVTFDAVGAGGTGEQYGASYSFSWTHTASGEGRAVVVSVAGRAMFGSISNIAAAYGGTPMTALTPRGYNNGSTGLTQQFILLNPPTGAQTVQVTVTNGGAFHNTAATANSVSYNNVASYTQGASSHGTGTSRSLTVTTADEGDMVAQAFGHLQITAMSDYNQTQRSNFAPGGTRPALLIGDSDEGDNSIVFTATGASANWSGVSVILHPA